MPAFPSELSTTGVRLRKIVFDSRVRRWQECRPNRAIAEAALSAIKVVVEELPHAIEVAEAADPDAMTLYDHCPVFLHQKVSCGDISWI